MHLVTLITSMYICSSYSCAVTQQQCTAALLSANAFPTVQCCTANQAQSMLVVTSITTMDICSPYNCVVTQQQYTAALLRAKCIPHCSLLLCKTGSQHTFKHINNNYGHLLSIQLCCDPRMIHCSNAKGKMHFPLFTAAVQNRLTAYI